MITNSIADTPTLNGYSIYNMPAQFDFHAMVASNPYDLAALEQANAINGETETYSAATARSADKGKGLLVPSNTALVSNFGNGAITTEQPLDSRYDISRLREKLFQCRDVIASTSMRAQVMERDLKDLLDATQSTPGVAAKVRNVMSSVSGILSSLDEI